MTGDGATSTLRLDDYAAYYRTVAGRFEHEVFGERGRPPVAIRRPPDLPRSGRPLPRLRLVPDLHRPAPGRRPPLARRRDAPRRDRRARGRPGCRRWPTLGRLDPSRSIHDLNPADARAGPRAGPRPARRREAGRTELDPLCELIQPRPTSRRRGLALLPEPSPLDLFFDIEADPWLERARPRVPARRGDGRRRRARLHADLGPRRRTRSGTPSSASSTSSSSGHERDPGMHVYHYGGYESGAIKRLMQRHATREDEVDRLLRGRVLVDLLNVVRQGIRASVESYSLKSIEHLFAFDRAGSGHRGRLQRRRVRDVAAGRRSAGTSPTSPPTTATTASSTLGLRDWLEARRAEAIADGWDLPRPVPDDGAPSEARRPPRPRPPRGWRRCGPACRTIPRSATPPTRRAGCWPRCSTTTGARPSRSGGAGTTSRTTTPPRSWSRNRTPSAT